MATNSPDASINPEKDTAGKLGALIKVQANAECTFAGYYILNSPKRQPVDGRYWVYMTASQQRADSLKVMSGYEETWVRFADYGIKLEPGRTYELRITVTAPATPIRQEMVRQSHAPISIKDEKGTAKATTVAKLKSSQINGHEYVDLGLPSGLLWATCNVGATDPEGYGNYYAWGETTTKSDYSTSTSTTYGKTTDLLKSAGIIGSDGNLTAAYDAASKEWGGTWRMPTFDEIKELIDNTTTTRIMQNGVYGRKVTSKTNGNSIFLPAAGYRSGATLQLDDLHGDFWSSSLYASDWNKAYYLIFNSTYFGWHYYDRNFGHTVRPVHDPNAICVTDINLSPLSATIEAGKTLQIFASILPANATDQSPSWSSSNTSVATVDAYGLVTAIREGTTTITATANDGSGVSALCLMTVVKGGNAINGHEYVDLGLSVKWATCNVGASKPEDCGGYYAWGEITAKYNYSWNTYLMDLGGTMSSYSDCGKSNDPLKDYVYPNNKSIDGTQHDVARQSWGGTWRMPTYDEMNELVTKCTFTWTTQGGVKGYKVTGPNGNSIFLPVTGYKYETSFTNGPTSNHPSGYYWTSVPYASVASAAHSLYCDSSSFTLSSGYRIDGYPVRPVSK